jgi:hypothetical protein
MPSSPFLWQLPAGLMHVNASGQGGEHGNKSATRSFSMLDLIMLACGIGGFVLLFGYIALCERL